MKSPVPMKCSDCLYFGEYEEEDDAAFCHRFPPVYMQDRTGETDINFPVVSSTDWCGEFRPDFNS